MTVPKFPLALCLTLVAIAVSLVDKDMFGDLKTHLNQLATMEALVVVVAVILVVRVMAIGDSPSAGGAEGPPQAGTHNFRRSQRTRKSPARFGEVETPSRKEGRA